MKPSQKCINLIENHEGFEEDAYLCPAGKWTIGFGTTRYPNGTKVAKGDTCTREEATDWLEHDLRHCIDRIGEYVDVPLTQNQVDALTSFIYNVGAGAFAASTLLRLLNRGDYAGAAKQFSRWNKGGGKVLPGLVKRRKDEHDLFVSA